MIAPSVVALEPLEVPVPLGDILQHLQSRLEERRITLRWVNETAPGPVLGNASQVEQLSLNLCLDAPEAIEPEGELAVRATDLSKDSGLPALLVEVSDTGRGVPDDMIEQIFNRLVRTKDDGTDLGPTVCRTITYAHRALLRARNNIGRPVCTFTVESVVPVANPAKVTA